MSHIGLGRKLVSEAAQAAVGNLYVDVVQQLPQFQLGFSANLQAA